MYLYFSTLSEFLENSIVILTFCIFTSLKENECVIHPRNLEIKSKNKKFECFKLAITYATDFL